MTIEIFRPVPERVQDELLRYSRALLEAFLAPSDESASAPASAVAEPEPPSGAEVLTLPLGVFVTLRCNSLLRGCIGSITAEEPLLRGVRRRTLDAAFHDKRFPPLTWPEVGDVSIEHSVLSPPRRIHCPEEIIPGEHGVILTVSGERGVFLPEVATQQGWDVPMLLAALAEKAGLDREAWRRPRARLEVFRTQHYGEEA